MSKLSIQADRAEGLFREPSNQEVIAFAQVREDNARAGRLSARER